MGVIRDLAGQRFGRWLVVELAGLLKDKQGRERWALWLCRCDCGTQKIVRRADLCNGKSQSCGCLQRELVAQRITVHGHASGGKDTATYRSWKAMITSCENPKAQYFENYGGRGITICNDWHSFEKFLGDMGIRPSGKTLDRIDPNGNYEKTNCRWATASEQRLNRRKKLNP